MQSPKWALGWISLKQMLDPIIQEHIHGKGGYRVGRLDGRIVLKCGRI